MERFGLDPGVNGEDDIQPIIIETPGRPHGDQGPTVPDPMRTPSPGIRERNKNEEPPLDDDEEGEEISRIDLEDPPPPLPGVGWVIPEA